MQIDKLYLLKFKSDIFYNYQFYFGTLFFNNWKQKILVQKWGREGEVDDEMIMQNFRLGLNT